MHSSSSTRPVWSTSPAASLKITRSKPFGRTSLSPSKLSPSKGEASWRPSGWPIAMCPYYNRAFAQGAWQGRLREDRNAAAVLCAAFCRRSVVGTLTRVADFPAHPTAERSCEGFLIVGAPVAPPPDSKLLPAGFERNLLCGIADATGRCLGLGIIERIDFASRTIALTTVVTRSGSFSLATSTLPPEAASSDRSSGRGSGRIHATKVLSRRCTHRTHCDRHALRAPRAR